MIFSGEREKIRLVLKIADEIGYGNLIAALKRQWIRNLMKSGLPEESATKAADVDPYSENALKDMTGE